MRSHHIPSDSPAIPGVRQALAAGRGPDDDGWGWLYRAFEAVAPPNSAVRRIVCGYFAPSRLERARDGLLFRALGVPRFGRFLPTGGIAVRRATGARMAPYTLSANSLAAARDFYYRACVFEALHLPFFLALAALALHRASIGRIDWAVQETVLNLLVNGYPILHHRDTRRRIVELLGRRKGTAA